MLQAICTHYGFMLLGSQKWATLTVEPFILLLGLSPSKYKSGIISRVLHFIYLFVYL